MQHLALSSFLLPLLRPKPPQAVLALICTRSPAVVLKRLRESRGPRATLAALAVVRSELPEQAVIADWERRLGFAGLL